MSANATKVTALGGGADPLVPRTAMLYYYYVYCNHTKATTCSFVGTFPAQFTTYVVLMDANAFQLELWDVRSWRPVLTYHGHSNTHSLLSLDTDDCEDFIAAGK